MSRKFLKDTEVAERYGVSKRTVYRMVATGRIPPSMKLSDGVSRWDIADLEAFEARIKAEA